MPEISLQAYGNEIDQLIEQARYLEALAHARHILGQYPRYVGAYYLLGKVLLEVDLPDLAADVFRRALSGNPEHLMARIGLGLAHERANNLDASIWNLTRALELDPGNSDISDELRRMYGRRDGLEPDYIKQTPAGLARLFIRGGRNGRAVSLLRGLLDAEPARPDLMTSLAEAYWRNEQIVQASDLCQEILDKMPYNCKANLLLGTLWVNSGQEEGWTYLRRAQEADPESVVADALFGSESLLEPQTLNVDRLVYDPDAVEVDQESAWFKQLEAASVSVGLSEAPPEMTESEMRLVDITAGLESQIEIPDWLKELGGTADEDEAGTLGWMADVGSEDATEVSEGLAEGELEGAVASQAPFDDAELVIEEAGDEAPEWLQELTSQEMAFDVEESDGAPDWLMELVDEDAAPGGVPQPTVETFVSESDGEAAEEALTGESADWLTDFGAADTAAARGPDWLGELQATVVEEGDAGAEDASPAEVGEAASDEVPDWLRTLEPDIEEPAEEEAAAEGLPDWIAGLAPAAAVAAEEMVSEPVSEPETSPEIGAFAATEVELQPDLAAMDEVAASTDEAAEEPLPDWMADLASEGEATGVLSGDAVPDWLVDFAPADAEVEPAIEDGIPSEEAPIEAGELEPEADAESGVSDLLVESAVDVQEAELKAEALPDWLAELGPADEGERAEVGVDDVSADWLSELTESLDQTPTPDAESLTVLELPEAESAGVGVDEGLTGAAALSWLDSLTAEATTEEPAAVAPEPEDVGGEPAALEVAEVDDETLEMALPEIEVAEDVAPPLEVPDESDELMSGDDALAFLESLTTGKEEELRVQAEAESEARVAEILGRRPTPAAEPEGEISSEPAPVASHVETEEPAEVEISAEVVEPETAAVEIAALDEGDGLMSGDDALAWLESLAAGKEEELRAQVEIESETRVAEIMGRRPVAREPEPELEVEPSSAEVAEPRLEAEPPVIEAAAPQPEVDQPPLVESLETTLPDEVSVEEPTVSALAVDEAVVEAADGVGEEALELVGEAPSGEGDLLSGDDALAWLEGLAAGKEEELRAQAEAESEARVAEILGRKPVVREPEPTEPEPADELEQEIAPEPVPEALEPEAEKPIEVETAAEAMEPVEPEAVAEPFPEAEAPITDEPEAVVTEAVVSEVEEIVVPPVPEVDDTVEAEVTEVPVTVIEASPADEGAEAPSEDGGLLSGDDALSWLQSLTEGKEDDLRAQAEAEAEARVDEILGRRRPAPEQPRAEEVLEVPEPETAVAELPEPVASVSEPLAEPVVEVTAEPAEPETVIPEPLESVTEPEEEQEPTFFGWSSFGDAPVEVAAPAEEVAEAAPAGVEQAVAPEPELDAGEDALTWLSELSPEKAAELEAQLAPDGDAAPVQEDSEFFGWSSFTGRPEEVAAPADVADVLEADAVAAIEEPESEPVAPEPTATLPVAETPAVEEAPPVAVEIEPEQEEPEAVSEAEPVVVSVGIPDQPAEEAPVVVVDEPTEAETPATTMEAAPVEAEADELDEMRAHLKRKRSDHTTRLTLARTLWQTGEIQESMQHYGRLIKAGRMSDEVMTDLEAYVASGPSSSSVMRTLGDAHMKRGNLEKALEIYNSAMNLL